MNPEYRKKLAEAAEADLRRREIARQEDRAVNVPNMERMPLGCWLWVLGLAAIAYYFIFVR